MSPSTAAAHARRFVLALLAILVAAPAAADTLEILPRGSYFEILGPMSIRGRDTIDIDLLPDGNYQVHADGMGLATLRTRFSVDRGGLRPESWAGPSSLLVPPGVDHLRHGESRGWFHLLTGAVGGAFLYAAADEYSDTVDGTDEATDKRNIRSLWVTYFAGAWLSASVESWLLTPEGSVRRSADGISLNVPRADRWDLTIRSVLVPGSGQRYVGRDGRANMFTALFAASAAVAIKAQDEFMDARRQRVDIENQLAGANSVPERQLLLAAFDEAESDEDTKSLIRWVSVGATTYVYLWNIFDAFSLGRRAEASSGPQVVAAPTQDGVGFSLTWRY